MDGGGSTKERTSACVPADSLHQVYGVGHAGAGLCAMEGWVDDRTYLRDLPAQRGPAVALLRWRMR